MKYKLKSSRFEKIHRNTEFFERLTDCKLSDALKINYLTLLNHVNEMGMLTILNQRLMGLLGCLTPSEVITILTDLEENELIHYTPVSRIHGMFDILFLGFDTDRQAGLLDPELVFLKGALR